jgi:hypothetical protein
MIRVLYICDECGIKDAAVDVRERGPQEDIRDWMTTLTHTIGLDHTQRSPLCQATHITKVMVPLAPGESRIGDPTRH